MCKFFIFTILFFSLSCFAQSDAASKSDIEKSRALAQLAVTYFEKNDYKKSTQLLFEAKDLAEKTGDHELTAKIYGSLSHQYVQFNLNDKAIEYLNKAIEQINQLEEGDNKKLLKGLSFLELGNIVIDQQKYVLANRYYKNSLAEFQSIKSAEKFPVYHYRRSLFNIGNSFQYLQKIDSAEIFLNKALSIKDAENKQLDFFIKNSLSEVYAKKGLYQRAIDSLLKTLQNKDFNNDRLKADIYHNLSKNYKKIGDTGKSLFYNENYVKIDNANKETEYKAINSAISAEQMDYKNTISNADDNIKRVYIFGFIFLIIIMIFIIYLFYRRNKERKAFELMIHQLKNKQEEISDDHQQQLEEQKERTLIPELIEQELLLKLSKFEKSGKFTNPKLTISNLALSFKTNTSYLSDVINNHKGKNFNTYINELRIAYICDKIYNNKEYLNFKISYLAEESGFASHSAFTTVFKNVTGISPSAFIRESSKNFT